jgi:predicted secreted Zn-dependent protease
VAQNEPVRPEWRKSSASQSGECVEVAFLPESVLVRHSADPAGPVLAFSGGEWEAFLTGVRNREFDPGLDWMLGQKS